MLSAGSLLPEIAEWVANAQSEYDSGVVTLHDWIDELCDILDIEAEVDEGLVLEVAKEAAHNVQRVAAPISTYLLGYAAALRGGRPEEIERLAGEVMALAEKFGGDGDPTLSYEDSDLIDAE